MLQVRKYVDSPLVLAEDQLEEHKDVLELTDENEADNEAADNEAADNEAADDEAADDEAADSGDVCPNFKYWARSVNSVSEL